MSKKKTKSMEDERVFRVWVHHSPTGSLFATVDVIADTVEDAAKKARAKYRRIMDLPCVCRVEQISVLSL